MNWYAIYTKSRYEKKVAEELIRRGVEVYCPVVKRERQWSDRKKVVEEPLFKSYVFVHLEEKDRHQVFGVPGFVRYLYYLQQPAIVKNEEIAVIRDLLNDYEGQELSLQEFTAADRVKLKSGPFMDAEAVVQQLTSKFKVEVLIEALGVKIVVDTRANKLVKLSV